MYSWEIEQFLRERNHQVTKEECRMLLDPKSSVQIRNVKYYPDGNSYYILTDDGFNFSFTVKE